MFVHSLFRIYNHLCYKLRTLYMKYAHTYNLTFIYNFIKKRTPLFEHTCVQIALYMNATFKTERTWKIMYHLCIFSQILEFGESPAPFSQLSSWAVYFLPGLA